MSYWPSNYNYLEIMRMNEEKQFNQQMTPRQTILRMLGEIKDRATNEEREEIIHLIIDRDTRLVTECDALRERNKHLVQALEKIANHEGVSEIVARAALAKAPA